MRIPNLLFALFLPVLLAAQAPQAFDFQAIARDGSGNVLGAQVVNVRFTLHAGGAGGPVAYSETHAATTNAFGLFSLAVGQGIPVQGSFASIAWGIAPHFLQVELDAANTGNYTDMGTTQLLSVPYALHARTTDCPTVSLTGDTLKYPNGCHIIVPGISVANLGCLDQDDDGYFDRPGCGPVDCDDANAAYGPGANEVCDGIDNDCDGLVDALDPGLVLVFCENQAGVCTGALKTANMCVGGAWLTCTNFTYYGHNANYQPGSETACDGLDNDCDGQADEDCGGGCPDNDGDGFGICNGDCDDTNNTVNPGHVEICGDGLDNDCDGQTDEGCGPQEICDGTDNDGDGQIDEGFNLGQPCGCGGEIICDGSGGSTCSQPGTPEVCGDGIDNDCNGLVDDGCTTCVDSDGDGYTNCDGDCNNNNPAINPGSSELCGDGLDNDCDGQADEDCGGGCPDSDGDGFGICNGDCDDTNNAVNPGHVEICGDGLDNDCDGQTDEGC